MLTKTSTIRIPGIRSCSAPGCTLVWLPLLLVSLLLVAGCAVDRDPVPDGTGSASIEPNDAVLVGSTGAWQIHYQAGPQGLPARAAVVFHLPLYWQWTRPQATAPRRPGYVWAERSSGRAVGELGLNPGGMYVHVEPGRGGLEPGELLTLHYGSTDPDRPSPVRADPFAEDAQVFRVAVDGDGDGQFADIAAPPSLRLVARGARQLAVALSPSLIAPGGSLRITVAPLDEMDNLDEGFTGSASISWLSLFSPADTIPIATLAAAERGTMLWRGRAPDAPGRYRVLAQSADLPSSLSDPLTVRLNPGTRKLVFADLHGHSAQSDGTGGTDDYHFYAWRVAGLGAAALTDHDHHGMQPLTAAAWEEQQSVARAYDRPGEYVTLLGYEYTNWHSGHRNVYFRDEGGPIYAWSDSLTDEPPELWARLDSTRALTIPHHTAGEPMRVDWNYHLPALEPVVEIVSVHGSSERVGAQDAVRGATPGHTVIDALNRGYRLGLIGSGDGHVGHPGRRLASFPWGLAGLWVDEHSRAGVWDALRRRSVFATTGPRIIVRFAAGNVPMGGVLPMKGIETESMPLLLIGEVLGTAPLTRVEIVKNGETLVAFGPEEDPLSQRLNAWDLGQQGDYYFLRVTQEDRAMAWSSPVWIGPPPPMQPPETG